MAQPSRGQRSLDGVIDPLQPLRVALATAAMPREQMEWTPPSRRGE